MVQGDPRGQPAALTDHATGTDHTVCTHTDIGRDARTAFDDRERPDAGTGVHLRVLGHHGAGMNTRHSLGFGVEQVGDARVGQIRVGDDQRIAGKAFGVRRLQQHRSRLAAIQELAVLRVGEEAQLTWASLLQGGQPGNLQRLGALESGAEGLGQLA